jgi:hypothetical protein
MFAKWTAIGSVLTLVMIVSTPAVQAEAPPPQNLEDLSGREPESIDGQIAALKLKKVSGLGGNYPTSTSIRFAGKHGEYEVLPGTAVLVPLAQGTHLFKFTPVTSQEFQSK